MTDSDDPDPLHFRKTKKELDWGKSHKQDNSPENFSGAKALVLHPHLKTRASARINMQQFGNLASENLASGNRVAATSSRRSPQARLDEATSLCQALDLNVLHSNLINLSKLAPATYFGKGKLEELAAIIAEDDIELVVFDCELTPGQQRNIEKSLKVKVIDRTGLILEIFGERAQTKEGVLQVELAHLTYQKSRLVRSWTHLERQRGGFGFLGGPGESQIESDRRMIGDRILRIGKQLGDVSRTRKLHRTARKKNQIPIVAMVGYTNAGKSTLFNYLTNAKVFAANLLFATLDPTMRDIELNNGKKIIISDTVGFISELPAQLVAAFKATLEEIVAADIILHVRDISHEDTQAQKDDVLTILTSLGLEEGPDCRIHEVWNKIDLLGPDQRKMLENLASSKENVSLVSAMTGGGCEALLSALSDILQKGGGILKIAYGHDQGAKMAWLYKQCDEVIARQDTETETILTARIDAKLRDRIGHDPGLIGRIIP